MTTLTTATTVTTESWRESILAHFAPDSSRLTLVADPDSLFAEDKLALGLRERGFDVIEYQDAIQFRYVYESTYRAAWDKEDEGAGEHPALVVLLRHDGLSFDTLPYDVLIGGRKLSFTLGELFPRLSYPVVAALDLERLDTLFAAHNAFAHERMGDNASKDFVLRHVFGIAGELIKTDVHLLRTLLRVHYGQERLPELLAARLVAVLQAQAVFADWPLETIIPDSLAFFAFLQQAWPAFIHSQANAESNQPSGECGLLIPFGHQDIRVYIDNCFAEGKLTPIEGSLSADSWAQCGLIQPHDESHSRLNALLQAVKTSLPDADAGHGHWLTFAAKWAELSAMLYACPTIDADTQQGFALLQQHIEERFTPWLDSHFAGLINQPPGKPLLLHHVPRFLARERESALEQHGRIALLVVDGLALDQWVTVRHELQAQAPHLLLREKALFAWVPTLTSISRQALFAGKAPLFFPATIGSTHAEETLWKQCWEEAGTAKGSVVYARGLGTGNAHEMLDELLHPQRTQVVGFVIDTVDKIMHGMQLGAAGMHNQIAQWCRMGFLRDLVDGLLSMGYMVWLTSDHGNKACRGIGRPADGVLAETRGERMRIYPTQALCESAATTLPDSHIWKPVGLPSGQYPLLAGHDTAFTQMGATLVGHGGVSLEEVIVPFIKIERKRHGQEA